MESIINCERSMLEPTARMITPDGHENEFH